MFFIAHELGNSVTFIGPTFIQVLTCGSAALYSLTINFARYDISTLRRSNSSGNTPHTEFLDKLLGSAKSAVDWRKPRQGERHLAGVLAAVTESSEST